MIEALLSESEEIKVYCPICKTDEGHFHPCEFVHKVLEMASLRDTLEQFLASKTINGEYEVVKEQKMLENKAGSSINNM